MIRIENIGRDVAADVRFEASRPIPAEAFGLSVDSAEPAAVMTVGPLIDGIAVLGPGDSRSITWGQYGGLMKAVGKTPIELEFTYRHERRSFHGHSRLEVASYTGTDASQKPLEASARHLEKIANASEAVARDIHEVRCELRERGPAA